MKKYTKDGLSIYYKVKRHDEQRFSFHVEGGHVVVLAPKYARSGAIEVRLSERFPRLFRNTHKNRAWLFGESYSVRCVVSGRCGVDIKGETIVIRGTRDEISHYEEVLTGFYKACVEAELSRIMYDAQYDFRDIVFPSVEVCTDLSESVYGNYTVGKNAVKLSATLAMYDPVYVKVVLYHELSHALVPNHSEQFLKVLDERMPGAVALDKKLFVKKYSYFKSRNPAANI